MFSGPRQPVGYQGLSLQIARYSLTVKYRHPTAAVCVAAQHEEPTLGVGTGRPQQHLTHDLGFQWASGLAAIGGSATTLSAVSCTKVQ